MSKSGGGVQYRYMNPDSHGLIMNLDKDGILGLDVRAGLAAEREALMVSGTSRASMVSLDAAPPLKPTSVRVTFGPQVADNVATGGRIFRSGLDFELSVKNWPNGQVDIGLNSRQMFDASGKVANSRFSTSELQARFHEGVMDLDWYATTVSGRNIGTEMIGRAIGVVGKENVASLRATLGHTNRSIYDFNISKGFAPTDAAWQIPLGKSMSSLGFSKVQVSNSGYGVIFAR